MHPPDTTILTIAGRKLMYPLSIGACTVSPLLRKFSVLIIEQARMQGITSALIGLLGLASFGAADKSVQSTCELVTTPQAHLLTSRLIVS